MSTLSQPEKNFKYTLLAKWGRLVLGEGDGGGFTALPSILDKYELALGVDPLEMWLLKRLLNHYWAAGEEVYPSFNKIARQAKISLPTLRKLRRQLEAKGFIKVTGKREDSSNRKTISLAPLRMALSLCVLADPQSKLAKDQRRATIREELTKALGNDDALYSWYVGKSDWGDFKLPFGVEDVKVLAHRNKLTLNWDEIAAMQTRAAAEVQKDSRQYRNRVYLKAAVKEAADGYFTVRWSFKDAFKLLQWLEAGAVDSSTLHAIAKQYTQTLADSGKKHSFTAFDKYVRRSVEALNQAQSARSYASAQVGYENTFS